jgi:dTDP-4-dehydrorhamnose 3,5-epimerase
MPSHLAPAASTQIVGVELKRLKTHRDDRGFFREVIRCTDSFFSGEPFGQWSHSRMVKDVVKAWHYHHVQTDWWYLALGEVETVLFDNRPESPTYKTKMVFRMSGGDSAHQSAGEEPVLCVKIPPGVLHGLKVLSPEAHLFYITSVTYDPNEEGRFPYNSPLVPHSWGEPALVVDNDKREFVPTSMRVPLK